MNRTSEVQDHMQVLILRTQLAILWDAVEMNITVKVNPASFFF